MVNCKTATATKCAIESLMHSDLSRARHGCAMTLDTLILAVFATRANASMPGKGNFSCQRCELHGQRKNLSIQHKEQGGGDDSAENIFSRTTEPNGVWRSDRPAGLGQRSERTRRSRARPLRLWYLEGVATLLCGKQGGELTA